MASLAQLLFRSGSRTNGFLGPLGAVGGTSGPDGLNRPALFASASLCAAVAAGCGGEFGGRSSPPLRPQPPSAISAPASTTTAHRQDAGLEIRFTVKSPMRARPYKDCRVLARAGPS